MPRPFRILADWWAAADLAAAEAARQARRRRQRAEALELAVRLVGPAVAACRADDVHLDQLAEAACAVADDLLDYIEGDS